MEAQSCTGVGGSKYDTEDPASAACLHLVILAQKSFEPSTSYIRHSHTIGSVFQEHNFWPMCFVVRVEEKSRSVEYLVFLASF